MSRNPLEGIVPDIVRRIDEGRKKGMKVVVVDPRRSAIAERYADRWIPVKPGSDSAFLLSLIYYMIKKGTYDEEFLMKCSNAPLMIYDDMTSAGVYAPSLLYEGEVNGRIARTAFLYLMKEGEKVYPRVGDICGVKEDDIRYVAEGLWDNHPASVVDDGWHTSFSTDSTYAWMSALIVNAVLGNLDRRGGLMFSKKANVSLVERKMEGRIDRVRYPLSYASFQEVYRSILTGSPYPVRALMVVGTNLDGRDPNSEMVRKALSQVEFMVVVDVMPSDVTEYADVVLAESTYLERDELPLPVGWTLESWVDVHQKALEPLYDTKPLWWIILELDHRLGLSNDTYDTLEESLCAPTLPSLGCVSPSRSYRRCTLTR
ncbi:molybdopterin-dependent oxidoreductase [Sulfuracidifex tepidarius]|uniref:molybdopterin-dependent oxidoreductase n=1 Tax=Sulfuracidifex tepidarius TaxID=1294262 RepID=UPI0013904AA0|nr:molybdopterin-dependent oxidoreductase [Sulfuracidifex tepidarius]